jgi:1-deoxy-D-xylulose-5-phosphate reductoisomerase
LQLESKKIAVLGATGSVGTTTLGLVEDVNTKASGVPYDGPVSIEVLTANTDAEGLAKLALKFKPDRVVLGDEKNLSILKDALSGTSIDVASGRAALIEAGAGDADWVMAAIVGTAGLAPTLEAVKRGATVALANKECLVSAGPVFLEAVEKSGATLLTADSEHNAIFQMFDFDNPQTVETITLTASGGPFRTWTKAELQKATPDQAVAHPNWTMGAKISVDSATLMNKGLEVIEAYYLFPVEKDQIEVVIHPQSIVHSFVSYRDGSVLAQLGTPDMAIPIAHTLAWPTRIETSAEKLNLAKMGTLSFAAPDLERFPALALALDALQTGGAAPNILNAANEVAVGEFLAGNMGFHSIVPVVTETLMGLSNTAPLGARQLKSLAEIEEIDQEARNWAARLVNEMAVA